ncbi:DUF6580 family putative transport protein [Ferruginibacter albus]|uniref:DUF6580 family putative transport protein n=1 Tax=Ferruginibacter albus TaxID=2875540 RepID=UPI001CC3D1B3|nr:DUF6580 family putative transport protein [Ferruginibacter albus]UAY53030.1 hypothetical protein K9M53_04955 [Ferruginibacter albus]
MKFDKSLLISFILLIVIASLYRVMPGRPMGFAPHIAMALFGGAVISDKKMSFILPLLSLLISDIIYEVLYINKLSVMPGFYSGQWVNYLWFALLTVIGFAVKKENAVSIAAGSVIGATAFFILSNFGDWLGGGLDINNVAYPKTWAGLERCYAEAIPFYQNSLFATLFFSTVLFGGYYLANKYWVKKTVAVA